jgi:hypothetical protein
MSGLMDYLLSRPTARDRFNQMGQMGPSVGLGFPMPSAPGNNWEAQARRMALASGYTPQEWAALDSIIERESGWDPNALNESSGAYGIPQILPSAHPDANLQGNPVGQIRWLLDYIENRYGDPMSALAFKDSHGWY